MPREEKGAEMAWKQSNEGGKRGRPRKQDTGADPYSDYITVSLSLPEVMVTEIEEYAKYAAKRRYCNVKRTEAVRDLIGFALATWRRGLSKTDGEGPPESMF